MSKATSIRAGAAYVKFYTDDNRLARGPKSAQRQLRNFGRAVRALGLQMMGAAGVMAAPFAYGVNAAGDAMETLNKFDQVFGTQAKAAGEFADALAKSVGRSRYEIRDSLSSLQAFFRIYWRLRSKRNASSSATGASGPRPARQAAGKPRPRNPCENNGFENEDDDEDEDDSPKTVSLASAKLIKRSPAVRQGIREAEGDVTLDRRVPVWYK